MTAAEQGCQLSKHWLGVFYHRGQGVTKNIPKALEFLSVSHKAGNCQSYLEEYLIYSQTEEYKDPKIAY